MNAGTTGLFPRAPRQADRGLARRDDGARGKNKSTIPGGFE